LSEKSTPGGSVLAVNWLSGRCTGEPIRILSQIRPSRCTTADGRFHYEADDVKVTIPFTRDGSNGTVRIMVGADGQATVISPGGYAEMFVKARVREICLTSVN
jgi:hypothetical protein